MAITSIYLGLKHCGNSNIMRALDRNFAVKNNKTHSNSNIMVIFRVIPCPLSIGKVKMISTKLSR